MYHLYIMLYKNEKKEIEKVIYEIDALASKEISMIQQQNFLKRKYSLPCNSSVIVWKLKLHLAIIINFYHSKHRDGFEIENFTEYKHCPCTRSVTGYIIVRRGFDNYFVTKYTANKTHKIEGTEDFEITLLTVGVSKKSRVLTERIYVYSFWMC